jgi:maltose/moltooligosaccharide transporter
MQSVFIGAGAVLASKLPGWLHSQFGITSTSSPDHPIPQTVHLAFTIGAVVFLLSVLWTVLTTKETPPTDLNEFKKLQNEGMGEIATAIRSMPGTMRQLASVQFFTWMALFCMWIFFPVAVARDLFGATGPQDPLYPQGITMANDSFAIYNLVAFFAAMAFLYLGRKFSARAIHTVSLLLGGIGLATVGLLPRGDNLSLLLGICFAGVGIAWASILSMPYAMLSASIPSSKMGVYMGIFNLFIVLPQILIAVIVSRAMEFFPQIHRMNVVTFGGACLILAAILTLRIHHD